MTVQERLGAFVKAMGWRPTEAAHRLGCTESHLAYMLRGKRFPGRRLANTIERLSRAWAAGPILSEEWDAAEDSASAAPAEEPSAADVAADAA